MGDLVAFVESLLEIVRDLPPVVVFPEASSYTTSGVSAGADVYPGSTATFLEHKQVDSPLLLLASWQTLVPRNSRGSGALKDLQKARSEDHQRFCHQLFDDLKSSEEHIVSWVLELLRAEGEQSPDKP